MFCRGWCRKDWTTRGVILGQVVVIYPFLKRAIPKVTITQHFSANPPVFNTHRVFVLFFSPAISIPKKQFKWKECCRPPFAVNALLGDNPVLKRPTTPSPLLLKSGSVWRRKMTVRPRTQVVWPRMALNTPSASHEEPSFAFPSMPCHVLCQLSSASSFSALFGKSINLDPFNFNTDLNYIESYKRCLLLLHRVHY